MRYEAVCGGAFILEEFEGSVPLKIEHQSGKWGEVYYRNGNSVCIETNLSYCVGQTISIMGFDIGSRLFQLSEVSITQYPALENAYITKILETK